jgi:hypothetical protein
MQKDASDSYHDHHGVPGQREDDTDLEPDTSITQDLQGKSDMTATYLLG